MFFVWYNYAICNTFVLHLAFGFYATNAKDVSDQADKHCCKGVQ
jgi:hypothetical protein